jgi:low affinity Fe/Cu permease
VPDRPSQIDDEIGRFDRLAESASRLIALLQNCEAAFFIICTILVVVWVPTLALFHSVDTWQLVLNTVTSVLAFLLIALLQNSERRYDRALHRKVDTLAVGLAAVIRHELDGGRDAGLERVLADLDAAVRLEERT